MTRKLAGAVFFSSLLFAAAAHAQRGFDVFAGYQHERPDGGPNLNGWHGAVTGYFGKYSA